MKRITKTTAAFLCFVLLLTFSPCNISSSAEEAASEKQGTSQESIASGNASAEAVFDLEKEILDWGEGITKVHIKFNEEIDAASVDADTFTVMVGTARRTITRIEVLGSEVIITMKSGQNTLGINSPIRNYVIAQNAPFKTSTGSEIDVGSIAYVPGDEYNAQTAKFTYHTSQSGMNYRMYSPPAEEGKEYAVLFWLHGYLQGGSDNESQILGNRVTFFASDEIQEKFDGMYVVAPQNPEDEQTWSWMQTDETGRSSSLPVLISLINEVIENNAIDRDRVYIGGFSAGGFMTWHTILEYPELFAAAIPVCSAYAPTADELKVLKDMPIWIVHSANDPVCPVANSRNAYDYLTKLNGSTEVRYSEYPNVIAKDGTVYNGHFSWVYVCSNYYSREYDDTYMDWLSRQTNDITNATFDIEAVSFDYGEDITKVVIDMKKPVDPASITESTFTVAVKDYPSFNWQTQKETTTDSIDRKVTGISVDGRYVTLELEHGFGVNGASTLMYNGKTWRNIPIDLNYEVTQISDFKRADGSTVAAGEMSYTQKRMYNNLVDRFDKYIDVSGISYVLYEPELQSGAKYPLIVWLHGAGEGGFDNKVQIRGNKVVGLISDDVQALFADGSGAYVLAPQSPTGWMDDADFNNRSDYLDDVITLIERIIKEKKIDSDKVYIGGCSMGGYMTWNVILTRPDLFAAAFPVCPAYTPTEKELQAVVNLPMWIVHSADDTTVNPAHTSRLTVPMLEKLGGTVRYTEFERTEYMGHWSWQYVFNNFYSDEYGETIMEWLATQDRTLNTQEISEEASEESPSVVPAGDESDLPEEGPPEKRLDTTAIVIVTVVVVALIATAVILINKRKPVNNKK